MSAIDRFASATASPLLVVTRLLLGLFLIWLGLTKVIPGWGSYDVDAVQTMEALTRGKLDGQIGLYLIGGWQVLTGLAVCIVPLLRLGVILLWLLLVVYGLLVCFHLPALHDDANLPTEFAAVTLRNALLTLATLAVASHSLKVGGRAAKTPAE